MARVVIEVSDGDGDPYRVDVHRPTIEAALADAMDVAMTATGLSHDQVLRTLWALEAHGDRSGPAAAGSGSPQDGHLPAGRATYGSGQAQAEAARQSSAGAGLPVPQAGLRALRAEGVDGWQPPWRRPARQREMLRWREPGSWLDHGTEAVELPEELPGAPD